MSNTLSSISVIPTILIIPILIFVTLIVFVYRDLRKVLCEGSRKEIVDELFFFVPFILFLVGSLAAIMIGATKTLPEDPWKGQQQQRPKTTTVIVCPCDRTNNSSK